MHYNQHNIHSMRNLSSSIKRLLPPHNRTDRVHVDVFINMPSEFSSCRFDSIRFALIVYRISTHSGTCANCKAVATHTKNRNAIEFLDSETAKKKDCYARGGTRWFIQAAEWVVFSYTMWLCNARQKQNNNKWLLWDGRWNAILSVGFIITAIDGATPAFVCICVLSYECDSRGSKHHWRLIYYINAFGLHNSAFFILQYNELLFLEIFFVCRGLFWNKSKDVVREMSTDHRRDNKFISIANRFQFVLRLVQGKLAIVFSCSFEMSSEYSNWHICVVKWIKHDQNAFDRAVSNGIDFKIIQIFHRFALFEIVGMCWKTREIGLELAGRSEI